MKPHIGQAEARAFRIGDCQVHALLALAFELLD